MTLYVGEQARIVFTGSEYGSGEPLTEANVISADILILDRDSSVLLEEDMVWDESETLWEYRWDTTDLESGTYKFRVRVVGADGRPSWEWGRARLAKNPTIVT